MTGHGAEAAHLVRLTFADRTAIEDLVENGVVLFFTRTEALFCFVLRRPESIIEYNMRFMQP